MEKKRFMERKRAAQQLRPWRVCAYYIGFNTAYDRALFKIVGRSSDGSGTFLSSMERDHDWDFKTHEEARDVADALASFPGITKVEIIGNITEEREVVFMAGPFKNSHRRRRRRRRLKRTGRRKRSSS